MIAAVVVVGRLAVAKLALGAHPVPVPCGQPLLPGRAHRVREEQRAGEHERRAEPVPGSERVAEVEDGGEQADELAQREHQSDGERAALARQHEHRSNADVVGEHIGGQVPPEDGQRDGPDELGHFFIGIESNCPHFVRYKLI